MSAHRWVEHTAELELEITGEDERAVFAQALRAFGELVGDARAGAAVSRCITLPGEDPATRLAQWLDELVFLAETEALVPGAVTRFARGPREVDAAVTCHRGAPRTIVKGVTYHHLSFVPVSGGYTATVVLDV